MSHLFELLSESLFLAAGESVDEYFDHVVGLYHFDVEVVELVVEEGELIDRIFNVEHTVSIFTFLVFLFVGVFFCELGDIEFPFSYFPYDELR